MSRIRRGCSFLQRTLQKTRRKSRTEKRRRARFFKRAQDRHRGRRKDSAVRFLKNDRVPNQGLIHPYRTYGRRFCRNRAREFLAVSEAPVMAGNFRTDSRRGLSSVPRIAKKSPSRISRRSSAGLPNRFEQRRPELLEKPYSEPNHSRDRNIQSRLHDDRPTVREVRCRTRRALGIRSDGIFGIRGRTGNLGNREIHHALPFLEKGNPLAALRSGKFLGNRSFRRNGYGNAPLLFDEIRREGQGFRKTGTHAEKRKNLVSKKSQRLGFVIFFLRMEIDNEFGASALGINDGDIPFFPVGDFPHDGESESEPFERTGFVAPIESAENFGFLGIRNADAEITNMNRTLRSRKYDTFRS